MNQPNLFHEDIWQALRDCVSAIGGSKKVGKMLRPELEITAAAQWLRDCLNESRNEKLCLQQMLLILREAKKVGCHVGMSFINQDAGYAPPQPIEPEDERAALMRQFNESVKSLEYLTRRIQHVGTTP